MSPEIEVAGNEAGGWTRPFASLARAVKGRSALAVVLAVCAWRGLGSVVGSVAQAVLPEEANLPILRWLDRPAVAIASLGCAVAILRGRRSALAWAGWAILAEMLVLARWRVAENPWVVIPLVAWVVALFLLIRWLPPRPPRPESRWRDLGVGVWATLALFVGLEAMAGLAIRNAYQQILEPPDPVVQPPPEFVPGLPTFATIGSSPAMIERLRDRPFSRLLAERYRGRLNFLFYREGGLSSRRLVGIARDVMDSEPRPDALILYVGHQDYNASRGDAFLRDLDVVGGSDRAVSALKWLIRQSSLVRLSLYLLWEGRYGHLAGRGPEWRAEVFRHYSENVSRIVEDAGRRGVHVFAVTVQADRGVISEESAAYMDMENRFIRDLPSRFPHVTLVDFEPVLDARYPGGARPDCEPFEPNPVTGGCGDPYHLGPRGHEVLADLLGPALERWVESRRTAPGAR